MNTLDKTLDSAINDLVEQLERDKKDGHLKLMNDHLFSMDIDSDYETSFDIGEPKRQEDDEITYI